MKLSIIVPSYNRPDLIRDTMVNIIDVCRNIDYELIIIDDCSVDKSMDAIAKVYNDTSLCSDHIRNRISVYRNEENEGVTKVWNRGVTLASGDFICIINNDVIFPEGFFEKMLGGFEDGIGMTCPRFTEGDSSNPSAIKFFKDHIAGHCFMFPGAIKGELFPLDERLRIFGSDNRLYYRLKERGYNLKLVKDAICHHLKSQTVFFMPNKDMDMFRKIVDEEGWNAKAVDTITEEPLSDLIF